MFNKYSVGQTLILYRTNSLCWMCSNNNLRMDFMFWLLLHKFSLRLPVVSITNISKRFNEVSAIVVISLVNKSRYSIPTHTFHRWSIPKLNHFKISVTQKKLYSAIHLILNWKKQLLLHIRSLKNVWKSEERVSSLPFLKKKYIIERWPSKISFSKIVQKVLEKNHIAFLLLTVMKIPVYRHKVQLLLYNLLGLINFEKTALGAWSLYQW
jgi:hypothetical protein